MNENIYLTFDEKSSNKDNDTTNFDIDIDISNFLLDEKLVSDDNEDDNFIYYCFYDTNYNVKQLLMICDYYGLKQLKKANKIVIIHEVIKFENDINNNEIVSKRKKIWFYMEELKKDKFLKKYILF